MTVVAATWLGRVPPPTQYAFPRFVGTAGFCRVLAYWAFFPPVLSRPIGRPGPACFVRGLWNSLVTGTPNSLAMMVGGTARLALATSCGQTPLRLSGSSQAGGPGAGRATSQGGSGGVVVGTGGVLGAGGVVGTGGMTGTGGGTTVGHYVVSADGLTVADTSTGLVWQRDGAGPRPSCANDPYCTWVEAKNYCAGLTLDGSGWRLPTLTELQSIVDLTTENPTINQTVFPTTPSAGFWTSSPVAGSPSNAWFVSFNNGSTYSDTITERTNVRCVR